MKQSDHDKRKAVSELFNKAYMDFVLSRGRKASQSEFARELGIQDQPLSYYLNIPESKRLPQGDTLLILARSPLIGPRIYDALGISREYDSEDPRIRYILNVYSQASPEGRAAILSAVEKIRSHNHPGPDGVPAG